jgi:hypothetical protein
MKNLIGLLIAFVLLGTFAGCSGGSENPVQTPGFADDEIFPAAPNSSNNAMLMGQWEMNFDIANQTVQVEPLRNVSTHFNVTPYLPPAIVINSIDPVLQTVDVDITVTNSFAFSGWDLRLIIYTDSVGHKLLNADEWTNLFDIPGGMPINPFKVYANEIPQRQFLSGAVHTENLIIKLPGMNSSVKFAIEASYPNSCPEPYWINDFSHGAIFDYPGSSTDVEVFVFNWLGDVDRVYLYCPQISGSTLTPLTVDYYHCTGTLVNSVGAGVGNYFGYIIAYTTVSGSQALYDEVTITVSLTGTPVAPEVISNIDTSFAAGFDIQGNYAFLADSDEGLKVIDISNPETPEIIGSLDTGYWFYDVAVYENHAFVAAEGNFYSINIDNKELPSVTDAYTFGGSAEGVCVEYPYAYISCGYLGTWIMDITDPADLLRDDVFSENDWANHADVQGDLMIVADSGDGIELADITNKESVESIKVIPTSYAYDVLIDGNYAYVADNGDGIRVVNNIYTPESADIVHSVDMSVSADKLAIQGNFLYVACGADGIVIFDVTVPETAYVFSSFDTDGSCQDIVVRDQYAYIADYAQGFTIAKLW